MTGPRVVEVPVEREAVPDPGSALSAVFTLADLDAEEFPPVRWSVPGLLPEGTVLFAGKPKMGKSWLAFGIGLAVATGGRALGQIPVEPGDVLYLALEDNKRRLKRRARKLMSNAQLPARFHAATGWPRVNEGGAEKLRLWLQAHPAARLILVDTLAKIRPQTGRGADRYQADYEATQALLHIAAEFRVCILIIHHLRKSSAESDVMDEISGSTGLTGGVDGMLVIKRDRGKADAVLHVDGRDIEEPAELALRFDGLTAQWVVLGSAEDAKVEEGRRGILDALKGGPMTRNELADLLDRDPQTVRKQLQRMVEANQVRVSGKRGKEPLYEPHPLLPPVPFVPSSPSKGDKGDRRDRQIVRGDNRCQTPWRYRLADRPTTATAYLDATCETEALAELEQQYGRGRVLHVERVQP